MRFLIASIRDAIEKDCLLPALMAALTIPDAMGQRLYPDLKLSNGKRAAGKQYAKWFDDWVAGSFLFPDGTIDGEMKASKLVFEGKMCWSLRCSLLHSGDYEVPIDWPKEDNELLYDYTFELILHSCNAFCSSWPMATNQERVTKNVTVRVDVGTLASALCDSAENCLAQTSNTTVYPSLDIFDLAEWTNRMNPR